MMFEDDSDEVMSTVTIDIEDKMKGSLTSLVIGKLIKVKCQLGFHSEDHRLSLGAKSMDCVGDVRIIIS